MWRLCAVISLVGTFAGCVQYHAAPLKPEHSADEFAARRLTEVQLRDEILRLMPQTAAAWPPREWDRGELLAVALTQNPQLAVARAQVGAARSHEITAAEAPNPDLILQSEYARHDSHPWLYGVSLNCLLRSPERRRLDSDIARLDTGNARLQLMDQAWAVRSALAAAPCTAMVFVWSYLTDGDPAYTLVQVYVNNLIVLVLFVPIVGLLVSGASSLSVPFASCYIGS